ncbi:ABC transporter permease subunit, partial [Acinetobacter baumannii]
RAIGVPGLVIVRRHIVPNVLGAVIVFLTLTIPEVMLIESFISFLGLGVQEPMTSWGVLISEGAQNIEEAPWLLLLPGTLLAL